MRFWIVGGGTGGHVYPAMAAAQALRIDAPETALTWVGTEEGMEAQIVTRENIPFLHIPGGGIHGVALLNVVRNGWELVRGVFVALRHLRRERPDAVLTTGGYISGPVALAAKRLRIPILVYLPDVEPAQSVKAVGRLATKIAVTVEASQDYFPKHKVVVTGYPLGTRITQWTRAQGRAALGLGQNENVLLVFGGSRGARSINRALLPNLDTLSQFTHIIHISGTLDWPDVEAARKTLAEAVQARYQAYAYLHENMGAALASADLVICRAGASILGEFPYFGLPSILVPYPYAWRYQKVNATWLAKRGAALVVQDTNLAEHIVPITRDILTHTEKRSAMSAAARKLARPDAAKNLAKLLFTLGQGA